MSADRYAPATREDDRARTSAFARPRRVPLGLPEIALSAPDVTPLERETVRALRSNGAVWQGDASALRVLRQFVRKSSVK